MTKTAVRQQLPLSIVIITKDAAGSLEKCLSALPTGCELVVMDSGSVDETVQIAERFGARVYHRKFDQFSAQKNAALERASRDWVLSLDADEELSRELRDSICALVSQEPGSNTFAYRIHRRLVFQGRVMRFGKTADRPLRLFRRNSGLFYGDIHEQFQLASGREAVLRGGCIFHHSYSDLTEYFVKFNRYTSLIASNHRMRGTLYRPVANILRPGFEFVSRFIFRLGFLDGYPGFCYALFSSLYAFVKYAKLRELEAGHRLFAKDAK